MDFFALWEALDGCEGGRYFSRAAVFSLTEQAKALQLRVQNGRQPPLSASRCGQPPTPLTPVLRLRTVLHLEADAFSTRMPCRRCLEGAEAARWAAARSFFMRVKHVARGPFAQEMGSFAWRVRPSLSRAAAQGALDSLKLTLD